MQANMDGIPFDDNQIYPSAPVQNDVDDLSVRGYATYYNIGDHDKTLNKVLEYVVLFYLQLSENSNGYFLKMKIEL